jgi:hypothetical protein
MRRMTVILNELEMRDRTHNQQNESRQFHRR